MSNANKNCFLFIYFFVSKSINGFIARLNWAKLRSKPSRVKIKSSSKLNVWHLQFLVVSSGHQQTWITLSSICTAYNTHSFFLGLALLCACSCVRKTSCHPEISIIPRFPLHFRIHFLTALCGSLLGPLSRKCTFATYCLALVIFGNLDEWFQDPVILAF